MVTLDFFVDHIFDSIPPMVLLLRQPILPAKIQMPQHRPEYFALPELHLTVEVVGCHAGKSLTSQTVHGAITTVLLVGSYIVGYITQRWNASSALFVGYIYIYIYIAQKDNFCLFTNPFSSWLNPSIAFKYDNVYAAVCIYIKQCIQGKIPPCWLLNPTLMIGFRVSSLISREKGSLNLTASL